MEIGIKWVPQKNLVCFLPATKSYEPRENMVIVVPGLKALRPVVGMEYCLNLPPNAKYVIKIYRPWRPREGNVMYVKIYRIGEELPMWSRPIYSEIDLADVYAQIEKMDIPKSDKERLETLIRAIYEEGVRRRAKLRSRLKFF